MPNQAPKGAERKNEVGTRGLRCSCCPPPEPLHPLSPSLPSSLCGHFSTVRFQNKLVLETKRGTMSRAFFLLNTPSGTRPIPLPSLPAQAACRDAAPVPKESRIPPSPGTCSQPRAHPCPCFWTDAIPCVLSSAKAVKMVLVVSELPPPPVRLCDPLCPPRSLLPHPCSCSYPTGSPAHWHISSQTSFHPCVHLPWQQQAPEPPGTHLSRPSLLSPVSRCKGMM